MRTIGHGQRPHAGRILEFWLNQLLYAGPISAGATMLDHFDTFDNFAQVGGSERHRERRITAARAPCECDNMRPRFLAVSG